MKILLYNAKTGGVKLTNAELNGPTYRSDHWRSGGIRSKNQL